MERTTRSQLETAVARLAAACGTTYGNAWRQVDGRNVATVGVWELDRDGVPV